MKKLFQTAIILFVFSLNAIAQKQALVDSLINRYYQAGKPGIALTIVKDEKTIYTQTVGLANLEYNISISDSTAFMIASVSKQFTAYLALLLEAEQKLNMNDDIRDYLPELKSLPFKISLAQLANHTHGLPNVSELTNVKGFGQSDRLWHKDIVKVALNIRTLNFKPGEEYQYNNTGFVLLSEIIERVTGETFQKALETYIFDPLEMQNTKAVPSPNMLIKNRAESYQLQNGEYQRYDANIMTNGSSGIRTTILDLAKWATHFQDAYSSSDSPFAKMAKPTLLNDGSTIPYGLGLETKNYNGLKAIFHGGGTAGYRAYTLHIPEHNFSVIILGNTNDYWPLEIAYKTVDIYLANFQNKEKFKPREKSNLGEIVGTYSYIPGSHYTFTAEHDTLFWSVVGSEGKIPLESLGNNEFVYPFYPNSKFIFTEGKMEHHIADFVYSFHPSEPKLKSYTQSELEHFVGFYHSKSLNTTYEITLQNDQLVVRHPINYDLPLQGLENNTFFSPANYFSELVFEKNEEQKVNRFLLSGQNLKNIVFTKIGETE